MCGIRRLALDGLRCDETMERPGERYRNQVDRGQGLFLGGQRNREMVASEMLGLDSTRGVVRYLDVPRRRQGVLVVRAIIAERSKNAASAMGRRPNVQARLSNGRAIDFSGARPRADAEDLGEGPNLSFENPSRTRKME